MSIQSSKTESSNAEINSIQKLSTYKSLPKIKSLKDAQDIKTISGGVAPLLVGLGALLGGAGGYVAGSEGVKALQNI